MPSHNAHAEPARFRFHSDELHTTIVRTYAYRATCGCGWRSESVFQSHAEAREAAREHRAAERKLAS